MTILDNINLLADMFLKEARSKDPKVRDELNHFRAGYGDRAIGWLRDGKIPPIILIYGGEFNVIGDGRGRVNLAVGLGLDSLPVIELVEK